MGIGMMRRQLGFGLSVCLALAAITGCATSPTSSLSGLTALQQRADQAYAHRDWRAAADGYKALTENVPDNAAYWFRLGNSYARLDQPQPAADAYRAALQRDPHLVPGWHNLGAVLLQQSQAAFQQAAANAKPDDPLKRSSALLAARIDAVRQGASAVMPDKSPPAAGPRHDGPAPAATAGSGQGGE